MHSRTALQQWLKGRRSPEEEDAMGLTNVWTGSVCVCELMWKITGGKFAGSEKTPKTKFGYWGILGMA